MQRLRCTRRHRQREFQTRVGKRRKGTFRCFKLKERISTELRDFEAKAEIVRQQTDAASAERAKREGEKKSLKDAISQGEANLLAQTSQLEGISADIEKLELSKRDSEMSSYRSNSSLRELYETARTDEQECRAAVDESRKSSTSWRRSVTIWLPDTLHWVSCLKARMVPQAFFRRTLEGVDGLLAESIKVQPGYEKPSLQPWDLLANSVTVEDFNSAVSAITHLKASDSGRVELLISRTEPSNSTAADSENTTLISVIEAPRELRDLLSGFIVAKDLAEAAKTLKSSSNENAVVVTLEGDYLSHRIVKGGGQTEPSKVELISERAQISEELLALGKQIDGASGALELMRNKELELSKETAARLEELQQQDAESAKKAEAFGRLLAQIESAKAEKDRLQSSISQLNSKLESDKTLLASLASELAVEEQPLASVNEEDRSQLVEALEAARQAETRSQVNLGTVRERLAAAEREEAALQQRLESAKQEKARFEEKLKLQGEETDKAKTVLEISDLLLPLMERLIATSRSQLRARGQTSANEHTNLRAKGANK